MKPADLDVDPDELRLAGLIAWARREADELEAILPAAIEAQWTAAPVARPREDTTERSKGLPSNPTADIVLDDDRLNLRTHVVRSEAVLREAIVALRGVRRGLERALTPWTGEAEE